MAPGADGSGQTLDYSSDHNGLSMRMKRAMEYGREYRQRSQQRWEKKTTVAVKIQQMSLLGLPFDGVS
eukprot:CAMPEP_0113937666 /NCGR_PEP_ID=MMETSP1339-20121228/4239_1 /TAXON_ID=94617 /ORGANISM="Fibrocapsa japonica" /LENGTH=67 /DNA_ID=CAMNT_0000940513 /DNA_START=40 /DNA_END=243 /DNA_ORIENTATION=- /assembly_acc=CAM_ASM_000762